MTAQDQFDITLTESFWRETYPDADDTEIAERLSIRRAQVAEHAVKWAIEEAQDRANLAARAEALANDQHNDSDDDDNDHAEDESHWPDDSDDEQPAAEYTEWDDQGNVIARGWNAHPDRCVHCGAWGENDHILSCPEHEHQDDKQQPGYQEIVTAFRLQGKDTQRIVSTLLGMIPAKRGCLPAMCARKVVEAHYLDGDDAAFVTLQPVSLAVFQEELGLLKSLTYTPQKVEENYTACTVCGCTHQSAIEYMANDGDRRDFTLCTSCFYVTEVYILHFPVSQQEQERREAVKARTKRFFAGGRFAAIHRASRVGQTAPKPNRSKTASGL